MWARTVLAATVVFGLASLLVTQGGNRQAFEILVYTASPDNLEHLKARFRDRTVALANKHGMTNIAYGNPVKRAARCRKHARLHAGP